MSSGARKVFDQYFSDNYDDLMQVARRLHRDHLDLLHHTYLTCVKALNNNENILDNLPGYIHTSLWNLSAGSFRKLYQITDAPEYIHVSNYDLADAIRKEEAFILANHLSWFDRTVVELYKHAARAPRADGFGPGLYQVRSGSQHAPGRRG